MEKNLKVFDTLDFDVFSNQKWERLGESHAKDIVVTWPDGHETKGIEKHIEDLKAMFVYAPDITIKVHPIRFGSGSWTTATGVMTGTSASRCHLADGSIHRAYRQALRHHHGHDWSLEERGQWIMNGCSGTAKTSRNSSIGEAANEVGVNRGVIQPATWAAAQ